MATSNYREPSCGQSETETSSGYSDHSNMSPSLVANCSQQATNTLSDGTTGAPGPTFIPEATANTPVSQIPQIGSSEGTPTDYTEYWDKD